MMTDRGDGAQTFAECPRCAAVFVDREVLSQIVASEAKAANVRYRCRTATHGDSGRANVVHPATYLG
jgi:Zn-finger nucleic acid-binding protein